MAVLLGSVAALVGCSSVGSAASPRKPTCRLPAAATASARTSHYQVLVNLGRLRKIGSARASSNAVATETHVAAAQTASAAQIGRVHLDLRVCTREGAAVVLRILPSVRVTDAAVGGISTHVALRQVRSPGRREAPHFGANITVPLGDPIRVSVNIAGEQATAVLRTAGLGSVR